MGFVRWHRASEHASLGELCFLTMLKMPKSDRKIISTVDSRDVSSSI
jgi:hypothetical protein